MSAKFEQLLDLLINEEHEKANELFHEIVVEKSRTIYENLIAEEDDEEMEESAEEEMDEAKDEDEDLEESSEDEDLEESDDEEMDESEEDLEDSYAMGQENFGGDATDDLEHDVADPMDADADGEEDEFEKGEDQAIFDIKNAIEELEAAFAELEKAQGAETGADFGDEGDDEEGDDDMMMGMHEGRRLREYTEKVGHDWEKNTQKTEGDEAGAGTGEKQSKPVTGKSPVSSGKGKPTTGATASNILGDNKAGVGSNVGTSPSVNLGGLVGKPTGEKLAKGMHNVDGVKSGVKTLKKQGAGYPGNNKSAGPVGSGTGDKAGQTNVHNTPSPLTGAPNRNA